MAVNIRITYDPHNPLQTPRTERAANLAAAAISAIRCGWSCDISVPGCQSEGRLPTTVSFNRGLLKDPETIDHDTAAYWHHRAREDGPLVVAPSPADVADLPLRTTYSSVAALTGALMPGEAVAGDGGPGAAQLPRGGT